MALSAVTHINAIISDQDKALAWYKEVLGAEVAGDNVFEWDGVSMRWLTVRLPGDGVEIVLMPPVPGPDGKAPAVGDGNMVVLATDDCEGFVAHARSCGVEHVTDVEEMPWGKSTVIRDLDGNPYNIVEPPAA
ncbi:MAG: VOC family protein [Thermoplasmatota archaeon]